MKAVFLNQEEQDVYDSGQSNSESEETSSRSDEGSVMRLEDGPKPSRTEDERHTEDELLRNEPVPKSLRTESCQKYGSMR